MQLHSTLFTAPSVSAGFSAQETATFRSFCIQPNPFGATSLRAEKTASWMTESSTKPMHTKSDAEEILSCTALLASFFLETSASISAFKPSSSTHKPWCARSCSFCFSLRIKSFSSHFLSSAVETVDFSIAERSTFLLAFKSTLKSSSVSASTLMPSHSTQAAASMAACATRKKYAPRPSKLSVLFVAARTFKLLPMMRK